MDKETLHSSAELERLSNEINDLDNPADKLKKTIELMEFSISQKGQPDFKTFWNARENCLALFKEEIPPAVRSGYWQKYRELTQQARLLKEHFEEESSFALEQIEKAIEAIENEMNDLENHVEQAELSDFPELFPPIKASRSMYLKLQKELNFLNAYASRINALRKEVAGTKMRMRKKNRFFERLSELGNRVFPKRKEFIETLSDQFASDIDLYIKQRFGQLSADRSPHVYREEIKALQTAAKMLSLNGKSFSETRKKLSECWDKIKELDKQRKKDYDAKKEIFEKNADEIRQKITAYKETSSSEHLSIGEAREKLDEIQKEMKGIELGREEVKQLREEIAEAKKPLLDLLKEEEVKRKKAQLEKEEQRQAAVNQVEEKISDLNSNYSKMEADALVRAIEDLKSEIGSLQIPDIEKEGMLRSFVHVEDAAIEKKDREEKLPEDPLELKNALQKRLQFKQERRSLIKDKFEEYRKASGSSGLDFEQSLHYNQQLTIEKERLEKISSEIKSVEERLSQL
ncbi:putative uncharacterized protein [Waddlia chondrophila 2032/99]|uniref:Uncharacterized protein n=2 Tax=Waddlia chondrophila TaxID=71667 RepID=D6YRN5_WADCW|nr:hypothetical protein [Waddlia chondrophila]ADI38730.1 conserved hypothetical protein [Waddlia chondrophila WSU 86-1044]CCB92255.1 putative uncharacterized protein [Waddlia chondrophila 2032/99]